VAKLPLRTARSESLSYRNRVKPYQGIPEKQPKKRVFSKFSHGASLYSPEWLRVATFLGLNTDALIFFAAPVETEVGSTTLGLRGFTSAAGAVELDLVNGQQVDYRGNGLPEPTGTFFSFRLCPQPSGCWIGCE